MRSRTRHPDQAATGMDINLIDDSYVRQAAHGAGLELAPAHMPGVVKYFRMIAGMAAAVNDFPLDESCEIAAIFTPCPAPAPD